MDSRRRAGWLSPALIAFAIAGVAVSAYLTAAHISSVPLVCTIGSVVNCGSVMHSAYSVIPGTSIPIGSRHRVVCGQRRPGSDSVSLPSCGGGSGWGFATLHLLWAALGLLVVLYLVYVEIVVLHQVCEWCTVVHLLVLATFVLTVRRLQQSDAGSRVSSP